MANKDQLRVLRKDTIINVDSKKQETELIKALKQVVDYLDDKFSERIILTHEKQWRLIDIIKELKPFFTETDLQCLFNSTSMKPDGGILAIKSNKDKDLTYPILISEVKRQGTNDLRKSEGLRKQSKGNAIERLGKNLIGFRTAFLGKVSSPLFVLDMAATLRKHPQLWIRCQRWQCLVN